MSQRLIILLMAMLSLFVTAQEKKAVKVEPSYAWSITDPLGDHMPAGIDTIFENQHLQYVPSLVSDAWATTGNYGAAGQNQIFMNRSLTSQFFMEDAIEAWIHSTTSHRFYNSRIPMTLLSYTTGGDKHSNLDRTKGLFSGNVNKRLQVGAGLDYIYSKGSYDSQADKNFNWQAMGSYMGDRYELQAFYSHYAFTALENGGITDDRFITDPAAVQGGETRVDNKSIVTRLSAAQNSLEGGHLFINNRYKVGFYRYQRDSVADTIVSKTYVPVTSFIWTIDFKNNKHNFINSDGYQDTTFFSHTFLGIGGTDETTRLWRLRNTLGVNLLEGFNKYAKCGLALYGTHEVRRFTQVNDSVSGDGFPRNKTQHAVWLGAELTKTRGSLLRYRATARLGVAGAAAGEIDITGDVSTRFQLLGDTVTINGYGYFKNLAVPYLLQDFVSNHHIWHNDFGKTQRLRLGGVLDIPHTRTNVNVAYETLKNHIYFGPEALPLQHSSPLHVLSVSATQRLSLRAFNWDNRITFQTSSDKEVIPLPAVALYSNLYVKFLVAKVLHIQLGVDCNYYTKYKAPTYNPANMSFYNQNELECGNFALINAYANFRLKRACFFLAYTHANAKLFGGKNYFSLPHYPLNPSRFQFGVSVNFAN